MNPPPVAVSVCAAVPTVADDGRIDASVGAGFEAINSEAPADVPPPGAAVVTVIAIEPAVAISVAGIVALSCVALTKTVGRFAPFHCTCDAATNPLPFTVRVKAAEPVATAAGAMVEMTGAGLSMANAADGDVPPPGAGFTTVSAAIPAEVRSAAVIATVNCVALT